MAVAGIPLHWDIFCSVVDNYGDVGVAWRLARQLASEHGVAVRLFVDALAALSRLAPQVDAGSDEQGVQKVDVLSWDGPQKDAPRAAVAALGDVVIEAFGCGLPPNYLAAMEGHAMQPVWINLEYLSAEDWIESCHGLASRHSRRSLTRHFFFPGFTAHAGGLLRERHLFARRDAFRARPEEQAALWHMLGVDPPPAEALKVSLFCYPDAPLQTLLDAWANGSDAIFCAVPEGVADAAIDAWLATATAASGRSFRGGALTVARVPFVSHEDYDRLLWACDLNFVRGEDSFVRAQWAATPLIWHCYPQTDAAHVAKLGAFIARYDVGLAQGASTAYAAFSRRWNGDAAGVLSWSALTRVLPDLQTHAQGWARALAEQKDLASNLVKFAADRV